ncbi:MAG: Rv1355c family protein [Bacteroidota bacterium]
MEHLQLNAQIFNKLNSSEAGELQRLITEKKPTIFDEIYSQLRELIKSKHPKVKLKDDEYEALINQHLQGIPLTDYGVWVYYSWSNRLVHLLGEEEFILVRTNRNQYKITPEEREVLSLKKIGVIGLSVGQSIALTMAMERTFGELRIADFDLLELSNLNRIRSGVHNLGISKVTMAAREIAEMDPFLKVVCFPEGLTHDNMDTFFNEGGKLDLLVDECDGLDIKIQCRYKARELGIPVIMDTSDRGMMDIERFDLEPDRPILHGLVGDLDPKKIAGLTNEQKIPYILPMVGADTISTRLKASMLEVEQTITTWPQLASSVALGGALGTDVARRILLNQLHASGRFYIDLDELIADEKPIDKTDTYNPVDEPKENGLDYFVNLQHPEVTLTDKKEPVSLAILKPMVEAACHAPSGGNMQPWKWIWKNSTLYLYHEVAASYSFLDYKHLGSYIGFGAAIENLKIKASENGLKPIVKTYVPNSTNNLIAAIQFEKSDTPKDDLLPSLFIRGTNRKVETRQLLSPDKLEALNKEIASLNGISLKWISDTNDLTKAAEIITTTDMLRVLHPQGHYDLFVKELRWNKEQTESTADGVDIETMESSASDRAGLLLASDEKAIAYLRNWNMGTGFKKISAKGVINSSAIGLITASSDEAMSYINGGSALQRVWIKANQSGLCFQPISASLFMFARLANENESTFNKHSKALMLKMYEEFKALWQLNSKETAIFMFKLHIAGEPTARSLRKPIEKQFYYHM